MDSTPDNRRLRAFFIIALPVVLLACIGGITWIALYTQNPLLTIALALVAFGIMRLLRWTMIWLSDASEKKLLGQNLEREPVLHQAISLLTRIIRKNESTNGKSGVYENGETSILRKGNHDDTASVLQKCDNHSD